MTFGELGRYLDKIRVFIMTNNQSDYKTMYKICNDIIFFKNTVTKTAIQIPQIPNFTGTQGTIEEVKGNVNQSITSIQGKIRKRENIQMNAVVKRSTLPEENKQYRTIVNNLDSLHDEMYKLFYKTYKKDTIDNRLKYIPEYDIGLF